MIAVTYDVERVMNCFKARVQLAVRAERREHDLRVRAWCPHGFEVVLCRRHWRMGHQPADAQERNPYWSHVETHKELTIRQLFHNLGFFASDAVLENAVSGLHLGTTSQSDIRPGDLGYCEAAA